MVAVHGLYGNNQCWSSKKGGSWLKGMAVSKDWEARVIQFGWESDELAKSLYTRIGIKKEALRLLDKLVELRKEQDSVSSQFRSDSYLTQALPLM
jgi:hypothetical protein